MDLVSGTERLLPHDEPETAALISRRLEREGLRLHLGFRPVRADGGRLTVQGPAGTRALPYDALLLGAGRKANIEDLGLETAGVRLGRNAVEVDEYLRTSNALLGAPSTRVVRYMLWAPSSTRATSRMRTTTHRYWCAG